MRMRSQLRPNSCEVKVDDAWRLESLEEVIKRYRLAMKRCPECHGTMTLYCGYVSGAQPFLMHHRSHTGCSLKPDSYSGTPSPHPRAVS